MVIFTKQPAGWKYRMSSVCSCCGSRVHNTSPLERSSRKSRNNALSFGEPGHTNSINGTATLKTSLAPPFDLQLSRLDVETMFDYSHLSVNTAVSRERMCLLFSQWSPCGTLRCVLALLLSGRVPHRRVVDARVFPVGA